MSSQAFKACTKQVRPILSRDHAEARRRALNLYKAWYRQLPYITKQYDVPLTLDKLKRRLREEFCKNEQVRELRVIDMLIVKGQMELQETANFWKQKGTFMNLFKDTEEPKPEGFLAKFLAGRD